ncbi:MAG: hypothetical protein Q8P30_03335 [Candidatus Uhrbacteria bacterium]|nr:hypothetical protein [Candidatus Uhrbacteria bacterium]
MIVRRPEQLLCFRPLTEQIRVVRQMHTPFTGLNKVVDRPEEALFFAFCEYHTNQYGFATSIGADKFMGRMEGCIKSAQAGVEMIAYEYLRPFSLQLAAHNLIANCLDPLRLFKIASLPYPKDKDSIDYRCVFEARRNFAIALQLLLIELADPDRLVADDLARIDDLSRERLFSAGKSIELFALGRRDNNGRVTKPPALYQSKRKARQAYAALTRDGVECVLDSFLCRIVEVVGVTYAIYAINRWKRPISTLLKLEANRNFYDRRGWKYVVVGVGSGKCGRFRAGLREDARKFHNITHSSLWRDQICMDMETIASASSPFTHIAYWDLKTLGRFVRGDDDSRVSARIEQIVTSLPDHMSVIYSREFDNHHLYKCKQVFEILAPRWFPHHGVNWQSKSVRDQLERWWKNQLL